MDKDSEKKDVEGIGCVDNSNAAVFAIFEECLSDIDKKLA